jgi:hypothetical protein
MLDCLKGIISKIIRNRNLCQPLLGDQYIANLLLVMPKIGALTLKLLHGLGRKIQTNPADIS